MNTKSKTNVSNYKAVPTFKGGKGLFIVLQRYKLK